MKARLTAVTHTGLVRETNDDYLGASCMFFPGADGEVVEAVQEDWPLVAVVADGLGGRPAGRLASRLAVEAVLDHAGPDAAQLPAAFELANKGIYGTAQSLHSSASMGTTASAIFLDSSGLTVVNIGDSPVFEIIDGRMIQLSTDDIPEYAKNLPGLSSDEVTQTLGGHPTLVEVHPHVYQDNFGPNRRILLATDGLTSYCPRGEIAAVLANSHGLAAVSELTELALLAGGQDNVSMVLIET